MRYGLVPLCARVLMATIFLLSGLSKITSWDQTVSMIAVKGLPAPAFAAAAAMLVELACGLALLGGLKTRWAAGLLFLYLIPVSLTMHDFWQYSGGERQMQLVNFLKNLAIMGGLLEIAAFGAGRVSLDASAEARGVADAAPRFRGTSPVPT